MMLRMCYFDINPYRWLLQGKVKDIELKGHTDSVDQLCWDPKHADLIATASGDKTVRLWDARSKRFCYGILHFQLYIMHDIKLLLVPKV